MRRAYGYAKGTAAENAMQYVRTGIWVLITAILVIFMAMNWNKVPVNIWPTANGYFHFDWPVGIIALVFFLLGLLPMWTLHKATKWRLRRKLENAERALAAAVPLAYPPAEPSPSPVPPMAVTDETAARPSPPSGDL